MVEMLILGLGGMILPLLAITPVRIVLMYERLHERDHVIIEITLWYRLFRMKYEIPMIKLIGSQLKVNQQTETSMDVQDTKKENVITKESVEWAKKQFDEMISRVQDFYPTIKKFVKHIQCKELTWHTSMGVGDAAATGTITGLIWSIKSIMIATVTNYFTLQSFPRVSVQPVWNQTVIHTHFRCILVFKLGQSVLTVIRLLLKLRKGRERKWHTTPSKA